MYNGPYFIPGYYARIPHFNMIRGIQPNLGIARSGIGILGRFGNGFNWFKNLNWGGIINNASRTLGIVNQTIPLVKQVGPMFNNMRSMFKIVSAFRDETSNDRVSNHDLKNNMHDNNEKNVNNKHIDNDDADTNYSPSFNGGPTFFTS